MFHYFRLTEIPKGFFPFQVSPYDTASDMFSMGLVDGDLESKPLCNFKPTSTIWARMPSDPKTMKKTAKKCGYFDGRQHPCHPMSETPCCSRDGECGAEAKHCYGPGVYRIMDAFWIGEKRGVGELENVHNA